MTSSEDSGGEDRLVEAFEQAASVPRSQRGRLLSRLCAGDDRLRRELESLLASRDADPDFLERLAPRVLPAALEALACDLDSVSEQIGHYRILARIDAGGMGDVYRARDIHLGREVAIKLLPPHLAADAVAGHRLRQEARLASALDHPNIATIYEIGSTRAGQDGSNERPYLAMAWCGDHTLADELERDGRLTLTRALDCAMALVDALAAAHEIGIVHGDVKPANLVVGTRGSIKLIDFGVATLANDSIQHELSGGTIAYMSPERLDPAARVDHRADIWAVGVVIYELLSGQRPFSGDGAADVAAAIRRAKPQPLTTLHGDLPRHLAEIIDRCLHPIPNRRHASAAALLTDLRSLGESLISRDPARSVVVLPFEVQGHDTDDNYLGVGFAEDVIAELSRCRGARVIAPATSRRLRFAPTGAAAAARSIHVRHAVIGALSVTTESVSVTASLLDARSEAVLWSSTLTGAIEELSAMRAEIADGVARRLGLSLERGEQRAPAPAPIVDAHAYEAVLRARREAWCFSRDGLERARRGIETALDIIGDHELLHGTLGHITAMHAESGLLSPVEAIPEVERLATLVFDLNPRSARGHWLRAWAAFQRGDLRGAIEAGEHAHALASDDPDVLLLLGYLYPHAGRNDDGATLLARALLLDPLTPLTQAVQGLVPLLEGRFAEAIGPYRRAAEMEPDSPFFATFHGWALAYARQLPEAVAVLRSVAERFPATVFGSYAASLAHGLEGESDAALRSITPAFVEAADGNEMFARELAHCYALAGATDAALDMVEHEVRLGMWNHEFLAQHDWLLDSVRDQPRFAALVERARREAEAS